MSEREFKRDENLICDNCNRNDFSLYDEVEKSLSRKYIEYDNCGHKICFHCLELASVGHRIFFKDINCTLCEKIQREKEQKEYEERKKEEEANMTPEELEQRKKEMDEIHNQNYRILRIMNGCFGFPII